jgi:predicted small lipoprotein YifL
MKVDRARVFSTFPTLFAAAVVGLALNGCGANTPLYGTPARAGVAADFPIYPGAVVHTEIYGTSPLPDGSKDRRERDDVLWGTDDSVAKVFAYYKDQFTLGDWVEQSAISDANGGGVIIFNRKSNPNFGGTIFLSSGKIHVIMGEGCPCGVPT